MLPKNPIILLSYVNTKLRDEFSSLRELCACLNEDEDAIISVLSSAGYKYSEERNKFI